MSLYCRLLKQEALVLLGTRMLEDKVKTLEELNLFLKLLCSFSDDFQSVFSDSPQECSINALTLTLIPTVVCLSSLADRPDGRFAKSLGFSEPINSICDVNQ